MAANTTLDALRNNQSQPKPANAPPNIMQLLAADKNRKQLGALAAKYMSGERMLALCVNAVRRTPKLAECDPMSVLGAMMVSAGLGLEPNTPTQQAFLIPYKKRVKIGNVWQDAYECQFQVGYRGFITLAYRSPAVGSIEAEAIHENDLFEHMQGSAGLLRFQKALKNRGPLIGAFCYVKLRSGEEVAVTLPLDEIHKIRAKSETYNALSAKVEAADSDKDRAVAKKKLDETPWVQWEDAMAAKSAIKQLIGKRLPLASNDPLAIAATVDEPGLDLAAMSNQALHQEFTDGLVVPTVEDEGTSGNEREADAGKPPRASVPAIESDPQSQASAKVINETAKWTPTPEEKEAIRQAELAESQGSANPATRPRRQRADAGAAME